jgi:hypothetical protein
MSFVPESVDDRKYLENVNFGSSQVYHAPDLSVVGAFCTIRIPEDAEWFFLQMWLTYLWCVIVPFYAHTCGCMYLHNDRVAIATASSIQSSSHEKNGHRGCVGDAIYAHHPARDSSNACCHMNRTGRALYPWIASGRACNHAKELGPT